MADKYFAYDPDYGFKTFETEELAKKEAQGYIDDYRDQADEGWDEMVEGVCWGEIKSSTSMIKTGHFSELDGESVECVDYKLV